MVLVLAFLVSALSVIYVSHATRALYASLQTAQHASDTLDLSLIHISEPTRPY